MSFRIEAIGTAVPGGHIDPVEGLGLARFIGGPTVRASGMIEAVYQNSGNRCRYLIHGRQVIRDILDGTRSSGSPYLPTGDPNFFGPTTGVRNRMYSVAAPELAVEAARGAFARSEHAPATVTHLVTVSCTGFHAPGIDRALIAGLGLRPTVERTHVGFMGCHGALNGLRVAAAYARHPSAVVLLVAVELCSLHYHYGDDPGQVVANAIFADGAAAVLGTGRTGPWQVAATGSCLIPDSADAMTWTIGDHGFEMTLQKRVPKLIAEHLRPWLTGWLASHGLTFEAIAGWAVHPGGPKILDAAIEALGLPREAVNDSRQIFAEYGNMSSPTVLFIVDEMRKRTDRLPCVMLGFGPGLTAEAVLLR